MYGFQLNHFSLSTSLINKNCFGLRMFHCGTNRQVDRIWYVDAHERIYGGGGGGGGVNQDQVFIIILKQQ